VWSLIPALSFAMQKVVPGSRGQHQQVTEPFPSAPSPAVCRSRLCWALEAPAIAWELPRAQKLSKQIFSFLAQEISPSTMETSEREKKNENLTTEKEVALLPHIRFSVNMFPF